MLNIIFFFKQLVYSFTFNVYILIFILIYGATNWVITSDLNRNFHKQFANKLIEFMLYV